jgi:hypothetical protein
VVTLGGPSSGSQPTNSVGQFEFDQQPAGSYTVSAPGLASNYLLASSASVAVNLAPGDFQTVEFRYVPGSISGRAYVDMNGNGTRDGGDIDLSGVAIALSGASSANTNTAAGAFSFTPLAGGSYSVGAPSTASGYLLASAASVAVTLPAGGSGTAEFRYLPGGITGRAYVDLNKNGVRDAGDVDLSGVAIALSGASSANTNTAAGAYSFMQLAGGAYSVGAPSTASGYLLASAASVAVTLPAGGSGTADFRYVPGAITGYAYVDRNKNKVFDAGDIGIGAVPITVAGPTNATTATVANGSYAVSKLAGGNYTVSAPATAAGYPLQTPNNVAVALPAGGSKVVNFGYYETAVPTCSEVVNSTSPFRGTMTFQDSGSGIVSLVVNTNVNFSVQMPSPMPSVSAPIKTPLNIVATRIDATKSATLTVTASDLFGNSVTCDPIATTVTKLKHELGAQTMSDVDGTMHVVTIVNDTPGLNRLEVVVNGVTFMVKKLDDGERVVVDIASALHRGSNNVVTLVPHGKKGDSATVTIGDR